MTDGDQHERRRYWSEQMEAASRFMREVQAHPVEECGEPAIFLPAAAASAGVTVQFSTLPHVLGLPRRFFLRRDLLDDFLAAAAECNARGWALRIEDAYRSRQVQKHLALRREVFSAVLARTRWELGGALPPVDLLRRRLAAMIAMNPRVGTHCGASAIDVSVVSLRDGTEIDRGAPYLEISEKAPMGSPFVPAAAQANRREITALMARHGFRAYPFEFWHYNKGDAYDEYLAGSGRPARYGPVDLDPATGQVTAIPDPTLPLNTDDEISARIAEVLGTGGAGKAAS